ncbi:MAG: RNA methyltransferase [Desulfobacteraceae bacterium]
MSRADHILDPVEGVTDYNHLSVRTAAAIILDRLAGRYE